MYAKVRLSSHPSANFLLLLATVQPCSLGKGWSLLFLNFVIKLIPVRIRPVSFFIGLEVDRSPLVCK